MKKQSCEDYKVMQIITQAEAKIKKKYKRNCDEKRRRKQKD